ncbi:hypothetical protein R1sor_023987 [Riccia sorocarpa]|uniref:Uncharacterized protein n=1 Tax=Riccia sorocarpa TaxID=122646 RepID=A0ABD3GR17_9MARC
MGRKSYKEVISLVCCSDATFNKFEHFVVAWEKGDIPDVYGAFGKPKGERDVGEVLRDFSKLSVNRFRPVNGLPDEDLKLVWTQLAQGSIWVSRPAKYQGPEDIVALKEYCKALKGKDKLGKAIVRYWMTGYQEDFNTWGQLAVSYTRTIPEDWLGEMLKYLPEKPEKEVVMEDVSSSDGDDEDSSKKKKKLKKKSASVDVIPSQIKTQLHKFHCAKHGVEIPQRLEPLEVLRYQGHHLHRLVYAYVSFGPEDYKLTLSASTSLHPTCNEYATKKGLEEMEPEKGEGAEQLNVKNKNPQWEFVQLVFAR